MTRFQNIRVSLDKPRGTAERQVVVLVQEQPDDGRCDTNAGDQGADDEAFKLAPLFAYFSLPTRKGVRDSGHFVVRRSILASVAARPASILFSRRSVRASATAGCARRSCPVLCSMVRLVSSA